MSGKKQPPGGRTARYARRASEAMRRHPVVTWSTLGAIVAVLAVLAPAAVWVDNHYETAREAQEHADQDAMRALYTRQGLTQLRSDALEDKVYDLAAKRAEVKLTPAEEASYQRYTSKLNQQQAEIADVKRLINERSAR